MKQSIVWGVLGFAMASPVVGCGSDIVVEGEDGGGGAGGAGGASSSNAMGGSQNSSSSTQSSTQSSSQNAGGSNSTSSSNSTTVGPHSSVQSSSSQSSNQSSQSSNQSSVTSGEPTCPANGDGCTECASTVCPSEWCACAANTECPSLIACWDACTTDACFQTCMQSHPSGISDAVNVQSCASNQCDECQAGWEPLDPCTECMVEDCEEPMNECLAQSACGDLWACLGECPQIGLTCQQSCYAEFGAGTEALQSLLTCTQSECPMCQ